MKSRNQYIYINMKQFLLLAGLVIFAFSSCNKDDFQEQSKVQQGKEMWKMVSKQNRLVLDPFNVAFRLNTYLVEKNKVDVDQDYLGKITDTLFGFSKKATLTQDGTKWKIEYPGNYIISGSNGELIDSRRTGVISIETGGKYLGDENSAWTVTVEGSGYTTYTWVYGRENMVYDVNWNSYSIACTGVNQWDVEVNGFKSRYYGDETADWTMTYYIVQNGAGDQSFESIKTATYSISNDVNNRVLTMYSPIEYNFRINTPIVYNAKCGYLRKTSGGVVTLLPYENANAVEPLENYKTILEWLPGVAGQECSVFTLIRFGGNTETVSYDLYPEPVFQ